MKVLSILLILLILCACDDKKPTNGDEPGNNPVPTRPAQMSLMSKCLDDHLGWTKEIPTTKESLLESFSTNYLSCKPTANDINKYMKHVRSANKLDF